MKLFTELSDQQQEGCSGGVGRLFSQFAVGTPYQYGDQLLIIESIARLKGGHVQLRLEGGKELVVRRAVFGLLYRYAHL